MPQRNELYALAEALSAPKTVYEIIMALNAPDNLSPYKKHMTDMIVAGVSLEIFIHELYVLYEIDKSLQAVRRDEILQGLKDEKMAEKLIHRQSHEYAMQQPKRLIERGDNILELELKAKYLQELLNVERPKLDGYEKKISENKLELGKINIEWQGQQEVVANNYIAEFDKKDKHGNKLYQLDMPEDFEERLKKAFIIPPPSKLLEINRQLIREAGNDEKKIEQYANTMAQKAGFQRILKTLDIGPIRIDTQTEKKEKHADVIEEHNISVKKLIERSKKSPPMPDVEPEKKMLAKAIKLDNERADLQDKVTKIYSTEKALNRINDKILVLKNQPEPEPPKPSRSI